MRERAKDHFLMAAAALTQIPDEQTLGFAVVTAAVGLLRLADSDPEGRGLDAAMRLLRSPESRLAEGRPVRLKSGPQENP